MANNVFANMFKIKDLRSRIFFTIIVLAVFRLGSVLTIPGIDPSALTAYFRQGQGNALRALGSIPGMVSTEPKRKTAKTMIVKRIRLRKSFILNIFATTLLAILTAFYASD